MGSSRDNNPALLEHCHTLYQAMEADAEDFGEGKLWKGSLTKLTELCGLGIGYYSSVTTALQDMGCIHQKRRGGGPRPSEWFLMQRPNIELFNAYCSSTTAAKRDDRFQQQIRDMNDRITKLQMKLEKLETIYKIGDESNA